MTVTGSADAMTGLIAGYVNDRLDAYLEILAEENACIIRGKYIPRN